MRLNCLLRRSAIVWPLIPLLLALGCATQVPLRPTEQVRARLGTIGVVSANFVPEADVPKAMGKAEGAITGAAKGLGLGLAMAVVCPLALPHSLVACLGGVGTPVWMAAGAVEGAKAWIPEEVEEQAKAVLKDVLDQRQVQRMLRDHLIQMGQDYARHPFVPLEEDGAKAVDEQADYRHLASRGIDTVLEVSVTNLGFVKGEPEEVNKGNEKIEESEEDEAKNLPFSLTMAARARLIRISDNEPLSAATYNFTSRERKWSEWVVKENCGVKEECGVKGAQALGEAIGDGHRILAQQIVDEFFSSSSSPDGTKIQRVERIPYRAFDSNTIKGLGVPQVKVRLATKVDVPDTLILWKAPIVQVLKATDIANKVKEAMEGRLNEPAGETVRGNPHLEVVIQRYGFVFGPNINSDKTENLCSVINAYIELHVSDQVVFEDRIFWEPYRRSMDIPPPQCATPSVFAAQEGKLARQTLEEAAEVIAAGIVRRLK